MSKISEPFTLPPSPKGLCFDKNQFLGDNFSVDGFLHDHRNAGSLEAMRDDLGIYLKVLRSAMIELINKDYADFVNLSANLIGLDKEINNIQTPLGQLKEEVLHVRECLSEAMKELSWRLEQRRLLREKKRNLQYLSQAQASLIKLNNILCIEKENSDPILPEVIERASSEYNKLQFTILKCDQYITTEQKELSEKIGRILETTLGGMFLQNLKMKKVDKIQRCLQIFSTLDKISNVEVLLRKEVISPAMHEIISESALQKHPDGLKGVFSNILSFINFHLKDSLLISSKSKKSNSVEGYNFLLNSFWPEVEYRIEVHMSSIFAPGNPELFYSRYSDSLDFIHKFLQHFQNRKSIETFYNHPQYKSFQQRWNLPVYFQIRFQEIAGSLENILSEPVNNKSILSEIKAGVDFNLKATSICWSSLMMCWAQGIFILALAHRFWKLSLQIVSRYSTWISYASKQSWPSQSDQQNTLNDNSITEKTNGDKLKFLIFLHVDINKLVEGMPSLLEIAKARLHPVKQADALEKSLWESRTLLSSHLPQIKKDVVLNVSADSIIHLKQLNDIPRLFRKTNRDIPSKPCGYIAALMKSPMEFNNTYRALIGENNIGEWMEAIFSIITSQYYVAVDDVLTSVQKTEESLRRLKSIRDRSSSTNLERLGVTDDDKIRLQLKVDVDVYRLYLTDLNIQLNKIDKLKDLTDLVEKATNKSITSQ